MRNFACILMASLATLVSAAPAQAIGYCSDLCGSNAYCGQGCIDDNDSSTTCEAYGSCNPDIDSDGVLWNVDNCRGTYNPGQENCDGDSWGDVCDSDNGTFVIVSGSTRKCQIAGRTHVGYVDVQMRFNWEITDVSPCGSPNRCVAVQSDRYTCYVSTVWDCCVAYFGFNDCFYYLNNNSCSC